MKLNCFYRKRSLAGVMFVLAVFCPGVSGQEETLTVRSVKIATDELTSVEDIRARMSTRSGGQFSEKLLNDDVRRLYGVGYMCTKIERRVEVDGIHLTIHVSSKAVIAKISLQGNYRLRERELKKDRELHAGHAAHIHRIKKEESRIASLYKEKGYHFAIIDSELVTEDGKHNLVFLIKEGPRVKISKIVYVGNDAIRLKTINRLTQLRRHRWFHPSPYVWENVEAATENLSKYYRSKGWLDTEVKSETEFIADNTRAIITLTILQGVSYSAGEITVSGNELFASDVIMSRITLVKGEPLDIGKVGQDIRTLEGMYAAAGYMLTRVTTRETAHETDPVVDIAYKIHEGIKMRIERIDIVGNEKTKDEVIRRELNFLPGEFFDIRKVRKSKKALKDIGIFEDVGITYAKGSQPDLADIDVEVVEKKTGQLMFGAGYSSYDRVIGFISLLQRNFDYRRPPRSWREFIEGKSLVGDSQLLKLNLRIGAERAEYGFDFREPWIFNKPISFGFGAYSSLRSYSQYDTDTTGGYLSVGQKVDDHTRIRLKYTIDNVDLTDIDAQVLPVIGDELGKNVLSALEFSGSIDHRDDLSYPTSGHILNLGYEYTGGVLGGDLSYQKFRVDCDWYTKLFETANGKQHVLKLSGDVRWAEEFFGTNNVPIYERYFAGGIRSVRGYGPRTLGPRLGDEEIGGNFRLLMNVEYVFPVYEDIVYGVGFYDTGEVWADGEDFEFEDLRKSVGIGVRLKTPVFPVEFYYGWALDDVPGEPDSKFHFALGYTF